MCTAAARGPSGYVTCAPRPCVTDTLSVSACLLETAHLNPMSRCWSVQRLRVFFSYTHARACCGHLGSFGHEPLPRGGGPQGPISQRHSCRFALPRFSVHCHRALIWADKNCLLPPLCALGPGLGPTEHICPMTLLSCQELCWTGSQPLRKVWHFPPQPRLSFEV